MLKGNQRMRYKRRETKAQSPLRKNVRPEASQSFSSFRTFLKAKMRPTFTEFSSLHLVACLAGRLTTGWPEVIQLPVIAKVKPPQGGVPTELLTAPNAACETDST